MSKVKKEIIEAAVISLLTKIASTMPNSTYKFILGGTSAFAALKGAPFAEQMLGYVSDKDGFVEVEQLKTIIEGAFRASDNKLQIDLFSNPSGILGMFVKPITLTITKDDIDQIMSEVEQNAIQNVTLDTSPMLSSIS